MTDKDLWEKAQVWDSSDDGRGKLKILESVEKFAELIRADKPVALQYPQKDIDWQQEQQIKAQASIPPQRTWVGLTDKEIEELRLKTNDAIATNYEIYKAIEQALKEKNI